MTGWELGLFGLSFKLLVLRDFVLYFSSVFAYKINKHENLNKAERECLSNRVVPICTYLLVSLC